MNRHLSIWLAFVATFVVSVNAYAQTAITLRQQFNVAGDGAVTIGDIARVKGADAERISSTIVLDSKQIHPGNVMKVDIDDVRRVLSAIDGFNWGEVTIRGARCDVVSPPPPTATHDVKESRRRIATSREVPLVTVSSIAPGTIRSRLAVSLAAYLDTDASNLKVGFRAEDSPFLDRSPGDLTAEVRPMSISGRIPVRITLFDAKGEREGTSKVVRVQVRVLLETSKAVRPIRRGSVIEAADVEVAETWMEPGADWAGGSMAIGSRAVRTIESGQYVRHGHVQEPIAVERGEIVFVRCVSGTVILRTKARATEDAKRGEIIELESLDIDRKARRRFKAKITGPGQAVVVDERDPETGEK